MLLWIALLSDISKFWLIRSKHNDIWFWMYGLLNWPCWVCPNWPGCPVTRATISKSIFQILILVFYYLNIFFLHMQKCISKIMWGWCIPYTNWILGQSVPKQAQVPLSGRWLVLSNRECEVTFYTILWVRYRQPCRNRHWPTSRGWVGGKVGTRRHQYTFILYKKKL